MNKPITSEHFKKQGLKYFGYFSPAFCYKSPPDKKSGFFFVPRSNQEK
jgi:hypothetical protein